MTTAIPFRFDRRLNVFTAPMGAGKTRWAMELAAHCRFHKWPLLAPTHHTALGKSQAAGLGIPWAPTPDTDGRLQSAALCWDDLRPSSALAICPEEWMGADGRGPVLVLDDIRAFLSPTRKCQAAAWSVSVRTFENDRRLILPTVLTSTA